MTTTDPQLEEWQRTVAEVRAGTTIPFEEQWQRYEELVAARPAELGPLPAWQPTAEGVAASNLAAFLVAVGAASYAELHHWSVAHRAEFWAAVLERLAIGFVKPPEGILDDRGGPLAPRWLPGAELNVTDACRGASDCTIALALGRDGSDEITTVTHGELNALVDRVAHGFRARFAPGTAIALYMPMNLECVAAYLGIVRAGGVVVSIADSFSPDEVARRLAIAAADAVITVTSYRRGEREIALYDKVRAAQAPTAIVIGDGAELRTGDLAWAQFLGPSEPFAAVAAAPSATTNILFSSGTTGDPKAIPWTQLTPLKAAMDGHLHHDIRPGDVVAWPTNIGWMMGPWLIYAALVNRAVIALYEGLPSGAGFCRFVAHAGITMLGVVPSLVRAWHDSDATAGADWRGIRVLSSTGEPSNRHDYLWLMAQTGYRAPVIEYCGGTEIGGGYITGTVAQPAVPATFTTPALGLDLVLLDDAGHAVEGAGSGEVHLVPPSIGLSETLLNRDHDEVYHSGCPAGPHGEPLRRHGDQIERLPGGWYRAQGRADDTMNLGGIKVSSREIESVLERHPAVYEAAAVAVQPEGEGAEKLVVFARPVAGATPDRAALRRELGRELAAHLNPLFKIHDLVLVSELPRTASNKLMRRELRRRYSEAAQ